jgi:hypothetical protein
MSDPTLVFANETFDGTELVVNFGVHAGREATQAEIDRLAKTLLDEVESFAVVSENRYSFDREAEASVHQVRVELPAGRANTLLTSTVEAWARDCIAERSLLD